MHGRTITIAGLGLIGGSMALALRENGGAVVWGIDRDPAVLEAAAAQGAVAGTALPGSAEAAGRLAETDLLVLALAPGAAVDFLRQAREWLPPSALVTDVCGVKRAVVRECGLLCREKGLCFIGGHPMAGREKGGFAHADPALFAGASYILTPEDGTPEAALAVMREFAAALGCARLTITTPEEHDRMIAFTSQLPHVLAGAYVKSPCCPGHGGFSAGSYRDVSRVATVDETLWSELFLLNGDDLCGEIDTLIGHLQECRDAIASGDRDRLQAVLRAGREIKERDGLSRSPGGSL